MVRERNYRFKLKDENKLRVNPKHLAYYILLWIIYIDNYYNIYRVPKVKNQKYLVKIYQIKSEKKFRDAKFIYRQYPIDTQEEGNLRL